MIARIRKRLGILTWIFIVMFTVSCSSTDSGSSSSTTTTTDTTDTTDTTGSTDTTETTGQTVTITGEVEIDSTDATNLQDSAEEATSSLLLLRSISNISTSSANVEAVTDAAVAGGIARLFTVDSEGNLDYTGNQVVVDQDGTYTFENIDLDLSESNNHVVKVKKQGYDSNGTPQMLEIEAYVPIEVSEDGETVVEANLSPKTTAVSTYVRSKIAESEVEFTNTQVEIIIELVEDLIDLGVVSEPEVITETTEDADLFDEESTTFVESDSTTQLVSTLDTNDEILEINKENTAKAKLEKDVSDLTEEEAINFIRDVFGVAQSSNDSDDRVTNSKEDSGPGDFFIKQFATAYLAENTATLEDLGTALVDSGVSISESLLTSLIVNEVSDALTDLYDYYDGEGVYADDSTLKPDIPNLPIVKVVFSSDDRVELENGSIPSDLELNVPQMILVFGMAGLFEDSFSFDPLEFTQHIGFVEIEQGDVYVMFSHVMPVSVWAPTGETDEHGWDIWEENDSLFAEVEVFGLDSNGEPISEEDIDRVILSYTKTDSTTGEKELEYFDWNNHYNDYDDGTYPEENIDDSFNNSDVPAEEVHTRIARATSKITSKQMRKYNKVTSSVSEEDEYNDVNPMGNTLRYELNPWGSHEEPSSEDLITDFASGVVSFQVFLVDSETADATSDHNVVKIDLSDIQWIFPAGPDMDLVNDIGWDPDYEPTIIPLEEGEDSIEGGIVKWAQPSDSELDLIPTSSELVYAIDIGLAAHPADYSSNSGMNLDDDIDWDWSDSWFAYKHIWDSWQRGTFIKGSKFKLPVDLNETENRTDPDKDYVTQYEINIRPLLRNKASKMIEWEGTSSRTNFQVGTPPTWEMTINGTIDLPSGFIEQESSYEENAGVWKVGLFQMDGMVTNGSNREWTDLFYQLGNNDARYPVANGEGELLVATLGTSSELEDESDVAFSFPTVSSEDDIFQKNMNYRFMVWFDYTEKPTWSDWDGVELATDGIEFSNAAIFTSPIEKHFHDDGNVRFENGAILYEQWGNHNFELNILSDDIAEVIELNPFSWFNGGDNHTDDGTTTDEYDNPEDQSNDPVYDDGTYSDPNPNDDTYDNYDDYNDDLELSDLAEDDVTVTVSDDGTITFTDDDGHSIVVESTGDIIVLDETGVEVSNNLNITLAIEYLGSDIIIEDEHGNELIITIESLTGDVSVDYVDSSVITDDSDDSSSTVDDTPDTSTNTDDDDSNNDGSEENEPTEDTLFEILDSEDAVMEHMGAAGVKFTVEDDSVYIDTSGAVMFMTYDSESGVYLNETAGFSFIFEPYDPAGIFDFILTDSNGNQINGYMSGDYEVVYSDDSSTDSGSSDTNDDSSSTVDDSVSEDGPPSETELLEFLYNSNAEFQNLYAAGISFTVDNVVIKISTNGEIIFETEDDETGLVQGEIADYSFIFLQNDFDGDGMIDITLEDSQGSSLSIMSYGGMIYSEG